LRKDGEELRMPLRQRVAHLAPKRRRRIRDLRCQPLVGTGDVLPNVKAGKIPAPASLAWWATWRKMLADWRKLLRAVVARLLGRKPT